TGFFTGVAVNPTADDIEGELDRFRRKVEAGARVAMTQGLFDLEQRRGGLQMLGGTSPIPLLVGLWPITSHALALRLHNEVPGITLPDAVLARFAGAEEQGARGGGGLVRLR